MKILVVDDSAVMRKLVSRSIRQAGFEDATIVEAEDGQHGLEVARSEMPDVVLADWDLSCVTGIEMMRALREEDERVRVGFAASELTSEIRAEAEQAGASFFLSRPIDTETLRYALSSFRS